jgi:hypothetical protein
MSSRVCVFVPMVWTNGACVPMIVAEIMCCAWVVCLLLECRKFPMQLQPLPCSYFEHAVVVHLCVCVC